MELTWEQNMRRREVEALESMAEMLSIIATTSTRAEDQLRCIANDM